MKIFFQLGGAVAVAVLIGAIQAGAQISLTGSPYTQDFDSIGSSGTTPPLGWNAGTLSGALTTNGTLTIRSLSVNNGNSTTSGNMNYGTAGASDRALGSLAANGNAYVTQAVFNNATGLAITDLTISYDGEQWRDGGNTTAINTLGMAFSQQSVGGGTTFLSLGAAFNFTAPKNGSSGTALDGNLAANRVAGIGGNFTVNIANGETFWLRWIDDDSTGADDGLGIDNFNLGYTIAIPEPSTFLLVGMGLLGVFAIRRRR